MKNWALHFWPLAAALLLAGAGPSTAAPSDVAKPVRLAVVNTPFFSGLMADLIADFKKRTGREVTMITGQDIYDRARAGDVDIVVSHYGFRDVEDFVEGGYGRWPRLVFSNQMAIIGPKSDPAHIRGMTSASDAFRRIADAKAPFVPNALPSVMYLTEYLWERSGEPDKAGWYLDPKESKGQAIKRAEEKGAYVIWGALPFLRFAEQHETQMEILVASDPILQRVMASVVVNPDKVTGVNVEGAAAFEEYLTSPQAQARVAAFRSHGIDLQLWWPAARSNAE
jgi:tungstate transport system substrate-binding protein